MHLLKTIYWYDYETSGIDAARDRPMQFGGLRTTQDLEVVGDPLLLYCKPADDVLPNPDACLLTGITPQLAAEKGIPEADFMSRIHAEFMQPHTCTAGYNSIRFDDEFTRYGLYRNFFDPYAREWQGGNSRWDLIDLVRTARLLRPEGLEWPDDERGAPSFKLERLTAANGIEHSGAHDAVADVRATIELACKVRDAQPKLFDYLFEQRGKQACSRQIDIQSGKPLLHVSRMFPAAQGCASLVMPLAWHPTNKSAVIVYDLRVDPTAMLALQPEELAQRVFTRQADLPDGVERIPLKEVRLNACPVLISASAVDTEVAARMQIDMAACRRHWKQIHAAGNLSNRIQPVFQRTFPARTDPDLMLYDGFLPDPDRDLLAEVRQSAPESLNAEHFPFRDARLQELLPRYKARNFPESLSATERSDWDAFRRDRLTNPDSEAAMTLKRYLARIEELAGLHRDANSQALFAALRDYADQLLAPAV